MLSQSVVDTIPPALTDSEFQLFRKFIYARAGINLTDSKKALVTGRLAKRVRYFGLPSYRAYFELLEANHAGELQIAVDLLTTNETFFFRESKHFDFIRARILPVWPNGLRRVWSAACSSGEEPYTLAMVLAAHSPTQSWEVMGTDISTRVLEHARGAQYEMQRAEHIPREYLHRYCLRGIGTQEGTFLICRELRQRVTFIHTSLKADLARLGLFDLILLRNVLIYFDAETKRGVVAQVLRRLNPGGYLMIGHSESLNGIADGVKLVAPSIYVKV